MDANLAEAGDVTPGPTATKGNLAEDSKGTQPAITPTPVGAQGDQHRMGLRSMAKKGSSSYAEVTRFKTLRDSTAEDPAVAKQTSCPEMERKDTLHKTTRAEELRAEGIRAERVRAEELRVEELHTKQLRADELRANEILAKQLRTRLEGHRAEDYLAEEFLAEEHNAEERFAEEHLAEERLAEEFRAEERFANEFRADGHQSDNRHTNEFHAEERHAEENRVEDPRVDKTRGNNKSEMTINVKGRSPNSFQRGSVDNHGRGSMRIEEQMRGNSHFSNLFQCLDKREQSGAGAGSNDSGGRSLQNSSQGSSPASQRNIKTANRPNKKTLRYNSDPAPWHPKQTEEAGYQSVYTDQPVATDRSSERRGLSIVNPPVHNGQATGLPFPQYGGPPMVVPFGGAPQVSASTAAPWLGQPGPYNYGSGGVPYWNASWNPPTPTPTVKSPEMEALERQITQIQRRAEEAENRQKDAERQQKVLQDRMESREREIRTRLEEAVQESARNRIASSQQPLTVNTGLLTTEMNRPDHRESRRKSYHSPNSDSGTYRSGYHSGNGGVRMKPDRFDGIKTEWPEYKRHFEVLANLQGWSEREKAQCLAVSLSGTAQSVLIGLSDVETMCYETIVQRLEAKYDPAGRELAHRAELRNLRRKPDQGPAEWASLVEKLVTRAYPESHGRALEIAVLEHFLTGIADATTRHWLELKAIKTVPEAISKLIHYESVMVAPKSEMSRKPREVVAMVENPVQIEEEVAEDQVVAVVNGGQNGNSYPQRYSGQQPNGQNNKQGYRNPNPRPSYQGTNSTPRPAWQGQPNTPGNAPGTQPINPPGKEPFPNKGIVQMFRAQEKQMGDQNQTMSGQGNKIDLVLKTLTELLTQNKKTDFPERQGENQLPQQVEKKTWEKTSPAERKCWRCQQTGHMIRDCPVEASVIAALEAGLERTVEPSDIGDQPAEN